MKRTFRFIAAAVGCILLIAGCSQDVKPSSYNILEEGTAVPLITGQSLSVSRRLEWGLSIQSLDNMYVYSLPANDLKGYPFVTITATAPVQVAGMWELVKSVKGDEWNTLDETSPWTTTLTGATTVRDTLIVSNVGLSLPINMYKTIEAMGGMSSFKEIVAVDLQTFALRDTQDRLWNPLNQQLLTQDELDSAAKMNDEIFKANNTPQVAEQMKEEWKELIEESADGEITAQSVNPFANSDGSLDLKKVKVYVEQENAKSQGGEIQAQIVTGDKPINCFLWICQRLRTGHLPISQNVPRLAFYQEANQFGRPYGQTFDFITCLTNRPVKSTVIGCAPAAFIGLIEWHARNGTYFPVSNSVPGVTADRYIAYNMTQPTGFNGRPLIAGYMRSCFTGGGTGVFTTGAAFRDGGAAFLKDQGTGLRMVSNISHYAGNVWSAPAKADILIRNIGQRNRPVIAEYFFGFTKGHFAAVVDYAVYGDGSKGLNIRTRDNIEYSGDYTWYSLSGTWGTERGVFALE
jgi:hypothetical protein